MSLPWRPLLRLDRGEARPALAGHGAARPGQPEEPLLVSPTLGLVATTRGLWTLGSFVRGEPLVAARDAAWAAAELWLAGEGTSHFVVATAEGKVEGWALDCRRRGLVFIQDKTPQILAEEMAGVSLVRFDASGSRLALALPSAGHVWILGLARAAESPANVSDVSHDATLDVGTDALAEMKFVRCRGDEALATASSVGGGPLRLWRASEEGKEWRCVLSVTMSSLLPPSCSHRSASFSAAAFSPQPEGILLALGTLAGDVFVTFISLGDREEDAQVRILGKSSLEERSNIHGTTSDGTTVCTESNGDGATSVETACEVLALEFLQQPQNSVQKDPTEGSAIASITRAPPWLVVGTTVGLSLLDARAREAASSVRFSDSHDGAVFAPSLAVSLGPADANGRTAFLGCCATFVSPADGRSGERVAVFSARIAANPPRAATADAVAVPGSILLDHDAGRQEGEGEEEDIRAIRVVATAAPSEKSFLHSAHQRKPSVHGRDLLGMAKSKLGKKIRTLSKNQRVVRSSGYGHVAPKRVMFQPQTNKKQLKSKDALNNLNRGKWDMFGDDIGGDQTSMASDFTKTKYTCASTSRVWQTEGGRTRVSFCPQGLVVAASSSADQTIQIIPAPGGKASKGFTLSGHTEQVRSCEFSHCGALMASAGDDRVVRLWDWRRRRLRMEVLGRSGGGAGANTSSAALAAYVSCGAVASRRGSSASKVASVFPDAVVRARFFYLDQFLLSASANRVFVHRLGGMDGTSSSPWHSLAKTVSLSGCKIVTDVSVANGFYSHVALCACSDRAVRVLDFGGSGIVVGREISGAHRRPIRQVVQPRLANDVRMCDLFVTVSAGDGAKLWDIRSSASSCVQRFDCSGNCVIGGGADFGPGGGSLALGADDGRCYLYDLRRANGHFAALVADDSTSAFPVTGVTFGDSGQLACAYQDGSVVFFRDESDSN